MKEITGLGYNKDQLIAKVTKSLSCTKVAAEELTLAACNFDIGVVELFCTYSTPNIKSTENFITTQKTKSLWNGFQTELDKDALYMWQAYEETKRRFEVLDELIDIHMIGRNFSSNVDEVFLKLMELRQSSDDLEYPPEVTGDGREIFHNMKAKFDDLLHEVIDQLGNLDRPRSNWKRMALRIKREVW